LLKSARQDLLLSLNLVPRFLSDTVWARNIRWYAILTGDHGGRNFSGARSLAIQKNCTAYRSRAGDIPSWPTGFSSMRRYEGWAEGDSGMGINGQE